MLSFALLRLGVALPSRNISFCADDTQSSCVPLDRRRPLPSCHHPSRSGDPWAWLRAPHDRLRRVFSAVREWEAWFGNEAWLWYRVCGIVCRCWPGTDAIGSSRGNLLTCQTWKIIFFAADTSKISGNGPFRTSAVYSVPCQQPCCSLPLSAVSMSRTGLFAYLSKAEETTASTS